MSDGIDPRTGKRIRQERKCRRMTLKQLAARAGFSITFLSDIERGYASPPMKTLYRIADALEVSIHALIPLNDWAARDREEMVMRNG